MSFFTDTKAIMIKELKLDLRFKAAYFLNSLINPFLWMIPFMLIYYGLFHYTSTSSFAGMNQANYVLFVLLGVLASVFFTIGINVFASKFLNEKYWKTIESILVSPVNHFSIILGVGLSEALRLGPSIVLFLLFASLLRFPSIEVILLSLAALALIFFVCLGVGLVHGGVILSNENFGPIFGYFFMGWNLVSCFYYPMEILPDLIKPFAMVNPVFHGIHFIRMLWIENQVLWGSFLYLLLFSVLMPLIAIFLFNFLWKRFGIHGY